MTETAELEAPAIVRRLSLDQGPRRSFLADIVIDHGPAEVLGRFFLKFDTALRQKGILLSYTDFDELMAVNRANSDSWAPIVPLFDPELSDIGKDNGHAMLGRNASGDVVCSHACRLYPLDGLSLKEEAESLRLLYKDPENCRAPGEKIELTAPSAAHMVGSSVYSGAAWYRPDYRKSGVMPILSTLTRGVWFTRWRPQRCFSFMSRDLINAGVAARCHMPNVEWAVNMTNTPVVRNGIYSGALIWADDDVNLRVILDGADQPSVGGHTQIDRLVHDRAANQ